jgi:hypothetical protein
VSAAGIKHRAPRLVELRLAPGRELAPRVARAAGADESGNTIFRVGVLPHGRAVVASGAGISRWRKTLDAETGVRSTGCPRGGSKVAAQATVYVGGVGGITAVCSVK